MGADPRDRRTAPDWVPGPVLDYLSHVRDGRSIRALARDNACEPSTILRRVRRIENRRDDPLVESTLLRLGRSHLPVETIGQRAIEGSAMNDLTALKIPNDESFEREAMRVLRRLAEQGACLALAAEMETAVVVREAGEDGPMLRTAVVSRALAEALALKSWIAARDSGRILRYRITSAGRTALRDIVAKFESRRARSTGNELTVDPADPFLEDTECPRSGRYSLAESPLVALARRKDKTGELFLSDGLVAAGERLREDFELARVGSAGVFEPEGLLAEAVHQTSEDNDEAGGAETPRRRMALALGALGPGLGDVALRCCCYLEGLESVERRMGWSARSAKIVLRIALQQLKQHYDRNAQHWSPLIG